MKKYIKLDGIYITIHGNLNPVVIGAMTVTAALDGTIYVKSYSWSRRSDFDIAKIFVAEGGQLCAIDEIHKKESWAKSLESIVDSFPELNAIASGSSSLQHG